MADRPEQKCVTCNRTSNRRHHGAPGTKVCSACYCRRYKKPEADRPEQTCGTCAQTSKRVHYGAPESRVCSRCYARSYVASRPPRSDKKACAHCGKVKNLHHRLADERVCVSCYRLGAEPGRCARCEQVAVLTDRHAGQLVCSKCYARVYGFGPCSLCGIEKRIYGRKGAQACHDCRPVRSTRGAKTQLCMCPDCGNEFRGRPGGRCEGCSARLAVRTVFGDASGQIPTRLQPIVDALLSADTVWGPSNARAWLRKLRPCLHEYLAAVGRGERTLCHADLEEFREAKNLDVTYLQGLLVKAGLLDRQAGLDTSRFEVWVRGTIARANLSSEDGQLVARYVRIDVLRRARLKHRRGDRVNAQLAGYKNQIREAISFLEHLNEKQTRLSACTGVHVDAWLRKQTASSANLLAVFLDWLFAQREITRDLRFKRRPAPGNLEQPVSDVALERISERCADSGEVLLSTRVAAALVAEDAQALPDIAKIKLADIRHDGSDMWIIVGAAREGVMVPGYVEQLVRELVAEREAAAPSRRSIWLFPSTHAHSEHVTATSLMRAIAKSGIFGGAKIHLVRAAALRRLIQALPSEVVSEMFGIGRSAVAKVSKQSATPSNVEYVKLLVREAAAKGRTA